MSTRLPQAPEAATPTLTRDTLMAVYNALAEHFGHEPHWWPLLSGTPQFEVLMGAVLVQQTRWEAVEGAVRRLIERGMLSPAAIAAADTAELAALLRPCAYYNQKAPAIQAICRYLLEHYGGDLGAMLAKDRTALRAELLALPRIGPETADAIMLYAGGHPVFVVDAYTRRLFERLGLAPGFDFARARYEAVQDLVERALTRCDCAAGASDCGAAPDKAPCGLRAALGRQAHLDGTLRHLLWDLHALITEICIHHCLASRPRHDQTGALRNFLDPRKCAEHCRPCTGCPLRGQCATYQTTAPAG